MPRAGTCRNGHSPWSELQMKVVIVPGGMAALETYLSVIFQTKSGFQMGFEEDFPRAFVGSEKADQFPCCFFIKDEILLIEKCLGGVLFDTAVPIPFGPADGLHVLFAGAGEGACTIAVPARCADDGASVRFVFPVQGDVEFLAVPVAEMRFERIAINEREIGVEIDHDRAGVFFGEGGGLVLGQFFQFGADIVVVEQAIIKNAVRPQVRVFPNWEGHPPALPFRQRRHYKKCDGQIHR